MSGYSGFARFYDGLQAEVDYGGLAAYYCGLLRENGVADGILLDLACGTGSLAVELSRRGYDVIAADASPEMLGTALEKPHEGIQYLCQDMEELDLFGTIDACVCALDSVNHLEGESAVQRAFDRVGLFMRPGGLFAFDVNTRKKHRDILGDNTFVYDTGKAYCVWQNFFNQEDFSVDILLDFFEEENGLYRRYTEEFTEYAYPLSDLCAVLARAGFSLVGCYEGFTDKEGGEASERVVFLARKL